MFYLGNGYSLEIQIVSPWGMTQFNVTSLILEQGPQR